MVSDIYRLYLIMAERMVYLTSGYSVHLGHKRNIVYCRNKLQTSNRKSFDKLRIFGKENVIRLSHGITILRVVICEFSAYSYCVTF